jgi:hypothetical protein
MLLNIKFFKSSLLSIFLMATMFLIKTEVKGQGVVMPKNKVIPKSNLQLSKRLLKPIPIKHEWSAGFRLQSDGWAIFADFGKEIKLNPKYPNFQYNTSLFQVELAEKTDLRQKLTINTTISSPSSKTMGYVFGKVNKFYQARLSYGQRIKIAGKPDPQSASVHWLVAGGLSIGMVKPYKIIALVKDPLLGFVEKTIAYEPAYRDVFLNPDLISGSAGFSEGLSQMKYIPGFHLKTGLHFDFSKEKTSILAAEVGVSVDFYSDAIQIMLDDQNKKTFTNMYVSFQFGKRK